MKLQCGSGVLKWSHVRNVWRVAVSFQERFSMGNETSIGVNYLFQSKIQTSILFYMNTAIYFQQSHSNAFWEVTGKGSLVHWLIYIVDVRVPFLRKGMACVPRGDLLLDKSTSGGLWCVWELSASPDISLFHFSAMLYSAWPQSLFPGVWGRELFKQTLKSFCLVGEGPDKAVSQT